MSGNGILLTGFAGEAVVCMPRFREEYVVVFGTGVSGRLVAGEVDWRE